MSWPNFEGTARSREDTLARIKALKWTQWAPAGITLHNTAAPTLAQWAESGAAHDARIRNLQSYYENELGWHAGPHFFVSRNWINWFSNPLLPGVHSRCWNATRFGVEMVGDFAKEEFDSGDGAMVRDNAIFLIAALNNKFGFKADDLTFHKECNLDNHDCPGRKVSKVGVIVRVKAEMARQVGGPISVPPPPAPAPSGRATMFRAQGAMSTFGGPDDTGMRIDEGLALYATEQQMAEHGLASFLVDGGIGLGRRLNPDQLYIACRWPTGRYPFLRDATVWVSANGLTLPFRAVDWGPNLNTGRVADLSPNGAKALKLETNDTCTVTVYADGK